MARHARFAKRFQDRHNVVTIPAPGFAADELLPATFDAAIAAAAAAIRTYAAGRRVALVGYSTGGLLAYATASRCANEGVEPSAVALIDSYAADTMWKVTDPVFDRMMRTDRAHPSISDWSLTAMGAYLRMLQSGRPDRSWRPRC